ncbi:unnamed protein product [Symbiodinium pilosum]|uniref:Uncharacterized protein n=1 Tax=Symbiodinium pilosum TaxID=2952 RepID=A0A812SPW1_SYMPI|nr:unnamed protein product [Symbiodinium pilosum]
MLLAQLLQAKRVDGLFGFGSIVPFCPKKGFRELAVAPVGNRTDKGEADEARFGPAGWLNATLRGIEESFRRVDFQVKSLAALASRRKRDFKVNVVLPVCAHHDEKHLEQLELLVLKEARRLDEVFDLYIYDVCFGFFMAAAYQEDNEVEVEVDLSSGAARPGLLEPSFKHSSTSTSLLPSFPSCLRQGSVHSLHLPPQLLRVARYFRRAFVVPFFEELPTGEVVPNLHHVAKHYDHLPDFILVLHPDGYEHVEIFALLAVLNSLSLRLFPEVRFLHLGRRHNGPVDPSGRVASELRSYCRMRERKARPSPSGPSVFRGDSVLERSSTRSPTGRYCHWVELAWELLFGRLPQLPQDDYGGYDFAQFIASRAAAQSRPKAFWQNAWRALCSAANYQLLPGTTFISWKEITDTEGQRRLYGFHKGLTTAFEHLYHVIFNPQPPTQTWLWPTRLRDPSLAFGLKFPMGGNPALLRYYRWAPHTPLQL